MTHANLQKSQQKNGKFPAKLADETLWKKIFVDLKGPYKIRRKGKEPLILKEITIIDPIIGWFKKYNTEIIKR